MGAKQLIGKCARWLSKESPVICAALAAAGVVAVGVTTYKAVKKSEQHLQEAKVRKAEEVNEDIEDESEQITPDDVSFEFKDQVKIVWKDFIGPVAIGTVSLALIFASVHISSKRIVALAGAAAAAERASKELLENNEKVLGATKAKEVLAGFKTKKVQEAFDTLQFDSVEGIPFARRYPGDTVFYDELTGQLFRSDRMSVEKCIAYCNKILRSDMSCEANTFYEEMGLQTPTAGAMHGWLYEKTGDEIAYHITVTKARYRNAEYPVWSLDLGTDVDYFRTNYSSDRIYSFV